MQKCPLSLSLSLPLCLSVCLPTGQSNMSLLLAARKEQRFMTLANTRNTRVTCSKCPPFPKTPSQQVWGGWGPGIRIYQSLQMMLMKVVHENHQYRAEEVS